MRIQSWQYCQVCEFVKTRMDVNGFGFGDNGVFPPYIIDLCAISLESGVGVGIGQCEKNRQSFYVLNCDCSQIVCEVEYFQ